MRAQQEQSDADTLVYVDIKKIASEINRLDAQTTDDVEVLEDVDVVDSLRGSEASIPPHVPAKPRARAPLAVFLLLTGLAILALQAGKPALAGGRSRLETLVMGVRGRLGAARARWLAAGAAGDTPVPLVATGAPPRTPGRGVSLATCANLRARTAGPVNRVNRGSGARAAARSGQLDAARRCDA